MRLTLILHVLRYAVCMTRCVRAKLCRYAWQLKFLSNEDWNSFGVSIGMRCCINRALAAGEILTAAEVTGIVGDDQYTALEMELEIREADASEWFLGLTEQAPWGAYLLLCAGLRPRESASSIYCLHHQLCNFTMYLWAPSIWIVSLIDKGMHADLADRWILGGFSQWHPRMLAGLEVLMILGIAFRAYPLHVNQCSCLSLCFTEMPLGHEAFAKQPILSDSCWRSKTLFSLQAQVESRCKAGFLHSI